MRSTTLILLAFSAAVSQAVNIRRQSDDTDTTDPISPADTYFEEVCLPMTSSESPDYNAPCWQLQVIEEECIYGTEATWNPTDNDTILPEASAQDQQLCICASQFFEAVDGCVDCADKHGLTGEIPDFAPSAISSFSASYCAATNTATLNFTDALDSGLAAYLSSSYPIETATTWTDPIGNYTEVSLYYTPSVTGSAAYVVSQSNPATTAVTTTSVTGSSGATTSATAAAGSSGATTSGQTAAAAATTTTASKAAAEATAAVDKLAVAGMMGIAAVIAVL